MDFDDLFGLRLYAFEKRQCSHDENRHEHVQKQRRGERDAPAAGIRVVQRKAPLVVHGLA